MDDNCKDCLVFQTLDEKVSKLELACIDHRVKIAALEKALAVNDEKFKQVFDKLDQIIAILGKSNDRLPNLVWGIAGMVIGGLVLFVMKGF